MNTGERIRAARKSAHLSQAELASRVGLSEPAIRLYELGKRTPKPEILTAIAKALGVTSESLEDRRMDSVQDVMEVLFQMEEAGFGIFPINTEDGTVIAIDPTAPHAPKLQMALDEWRKQHEALESKSASRIEYAVWRGSFGA